MLDALDHFVLIQLDIQFGAVQAHFVELLIVNPVQILLRIGQ